MAGESGGGGAAAAGTATTILGGINTAVGAYYEAKNAKYLARSQAMSLEFEGSIADINARQAERDAGMVLESYRYDNMRLTLAAGMEKASLLTEQAAGGVQVGNGSAAEAMASRELASRMDQRALAMSSMRDLAAVRSRVTDLRNQANLSRVSASNVRRMSKAISPGAAFHIGLAGTGRYQSAPAIASYYGGRGGSK